MEAIKISVEVSVNLSENTQSFIKSLLGNMATFVTAPAQKPAPVAPTPAPKPQAPAVVPAPTKSAAAPAPGAPAAQAASSAPKSIEDVRAMLAKKVNEHRDVIKQKLNEFGAPSVTKLSPAKYEEMFNFLESL